VVKWTWYTQLEKKEGEVKRKRVERETRDMNGKRQDKAYYMVCLGSPPREG